MIRIKNKCHLLRFICLTLCLLTIISAFMGTTVSATKQNGKYANLKLIPGGQTFGVKFNLVGVLVVGFSDVDTKSGNICPGTLAGLKTGDIIKSADGTELKDASQFIQTVSETNGRSISLTYSRSGVEKTVKISPKYSVSENKYKVGINVRDSGAGIGTVTYIFPDTYTFGGLGHGICSSDSGRLVQMTRGSVCGVTVSGVKKGVCGEPGEIRGIFGTEKTGSLVCNTDCGVFGIFSKLPDNSQEPISVGTRNEVKNGSAYIMSTLDTNGVQKYNIEISSVKHDEKGSKCFIITVKDPKLTEKTGGIVQGMSGSPIIQDGKLIGAVTHVMINDPTVGYGIFIENMLDNMPDKLK